MSQTMHWVYVIARAEQNKLVAPVKVGISNSPNGRLSTIQTACPFPVKLAYAFGTPDRDIAAFFESAFHHTQAEHRLHGEWFNLDPQIAISVVCLHFSLAVSSMDLSDEEKNKALRLVGVIDAQTKVFGGSDVAYTNH